VLRLAWERLSRRPGVVIFEGMAVRTREGVKPVYVSPGHLMDLGTAVETVPRVTQRFREPETTRRAHRLVNRARITALASGGG